MQSFYENDIQPGRPNFIDNKVVVVDGLIGGGKGLISQIIAALPGVEMWVHRPQLEQICGLKHLGHISTEGAITLIKNWVDEEAYNLSMLRNANCRVSDKSSIFNYPRKLQYFMRFIQKGRAESMKIFVNNRRILNFMTHANTAYSEPIFKALGNRLVYIRIVRSPISAEYIFNHLAQWSERWGNDIRSGMLTYCMQEENSEHNYLPFFIDPGQSEKYQKACPIDKSIYMLKTWLNEGDSAIDILKTKYSAQVIEIPFEKFVFNPDGFINEIAASLKVKIDRKARKEMKKQKIPRKTLSDAPRIDAYTEVGWKKPTINLSVKEEFSRTKQAIKQRASKAAFKELEQIYHRYTERYNIF